jgi:hypothetical protein
MPTQGLQTGLQCVGRLGRVQKYGERLATDDPFQLTRHRFYRLQGPYHLDQIHSIGQTYRSGQKTTGDMLLSDAAGAHRHQVGPGLEEEGLLGQIGFEKPGRNFGHLPPAHR